MSLLIKGIKMPERCDECNLCDNLGMCIPLGEDLFNYLDKEIAEAEPVRFFPDNWKCSDCPLIELPTPHGRLGDLDKIASDEADAYLSAQITIATTRNKDDEQEALMAINDIVHKKLQMLLKDAPTVIEAEEVEE